MASSLQGVKVMSSTEGVLSSNGMAWSDDWDYRMMFQHIKRGCSMSNSISLTRHPLDWSCTGMYIGCGQVKDDILMF